MEHTHRQPPPRSKGSFLVQTSPNAPVRVAKALGTHLGTRAKVVNSPSHRGNGHDTSQSGPPRNPEVRNGNVVCPPGRVRKPNKRETTSSDAVVVLPRKVVVFSRNRSLEDGSNSVTSPAGHGEQGNYGSRSPQLSTPQRLGAARRMVAKVGSPPQERKPAPATSSPTTRAPSPSTKHKSTNHLCCALTQVTLPLAPN